MRKLYIFLLSVVISLSVGCSHEDNWPQWIPLISDMVISVPYNAYAPNPNTQDGKTLQAPALGAIPMGFEPHPYQKNPEDAKLAAIELKNPLPLNEENLNRGQQLYAQKCLVCHGPTGKADGPIIGKFPPPPSYASDRVRQLTEGNLYHSITVGVGLMGAYGPMLGPTDRWKLVHYVQHLVKELEKEKGTP